MEWSQMESATSTNGVDGMDLPFARTVRLGVDKLQTLCTFEQVSYENLWASCACIVSPVIKRCCVKVSGAWTRFTNARCRSPVV